MSDQWTSPISEVQFEQKVLERLSVGARYVISHAVLEQYEDAGSHINGELVRSLRSRVLADHLADDVFTASTSFEAPRSTWQMFKQTHAESWWLRWLVERHPVEMATQRRDVAVNVARYLTYPDAAIRTPEFGPHVIYETARQIQ